MTYSCLSRMLANLNINNIWLTPRKTSRFLCTVKGDLALRTPWVYSITCECDQEYILLDLYRPYTAWTCRQIDGGGTQVYP